MVADILNSRPQCTAHCRRGTDCACVHTGYTVPVRGDKVDKITIKYQLKTTKPYLIKVRYRVIFHIPCIEKQLTENGVCKSVATGRN
jgi:hypothetical protein